jgi:tRNA threonylcarbamoyladenosine biosynthesis protein TsaB
MTALTGGAAQSGGEGWALGIEISNPSSARGASGTGPSVAGCLVGAPDRIEIEALGGEGRHDDDLMPAIERLRARLGVSPMGLRRVCVSIGPGGFTGLRVAVATAKMLSEATGAEVVGVPSADVAALALFEREGSRALPALVCLASKRGTAHVTVVRSVGVHPGKGEKLGEPLGVLSESEFASLDASTVIADDHLPEGWARVTGTRGWRLVPPAFCAGVCLKLGMTMGAVPALSLHPLYPREPEAVTRWKSRSAGQSPDG